LPAWLGDSSGVAERAQMDKTKDARDRLKRLAEQLSSLQFPSSPISLELAGFAATAIKRFLSGDEQTLDSAFGLVAERGRPTTKLAKHKEITKFFIDLELKKTPTEKILSAIEKKFGISDERHIRRILAKHQDAYLAESVALRIQNQSGEKK
jgi:hypothetical protein